MSNVITRRRLFQGTASMFAEAGSLIAVREAFDHLLLGVSSLDEGIEWFYRRTGVRAAMGGVHPGRGTRNALASLGEAHYLEIIAPDPAQQNVNPQFQLEGLAEPRLINFAVRTKDISHTASTLQSAGVHTKGPAEGSRRTTSGELLRWRSLSVESQLQSGQVNPIPFFIEWASDSAHPSQSSPHGCTIETLRFEHPRAKKLSAQFRSLGLTARVSFAEEVRIVAMIRTPKGRVEFA